LGRPHGLSKADKLQCESLPTGEVLDPYDYGVTTRAGVVIGFSHDEGLSARGQRDAGVRSVGRAAQFRSAFGFRRLGPRLGLDRRDRGTLDRRRLDAR
jgi:hypothetical protein